MNTSKQEWLHAGSTHDIPDGQAKELISDSGRSIALFHIDGRFYAVDNQCPHRGYPLTRGRVRYGILTCDWHGRRFDLESGGCYNEACDDLMVYPVDIRGDEVWVQVLEQTRARREAHFRLLFEGLMSDDLWTISKAVALLLKAGVVETEIAEYMLGRLGDHFTILLGEYRGEDRASERISLLLSGLDLSQQYEGEDGLIALSIAGYGAVGDAEERLDVVPLPQVSSWTQIEGWVRLFSQNAQFERIERCLVTARHLGEEDRILPLLYQCVVNPYNLGEPQFFTTLNGLAEIVERFGWSSVADMVLSAGAKVIGRGRFDLVGYHRDAIEILTDRMPELDQMDTASHQSVDFDEEAFVLAITSKDLKKSFDAVFTALKSGVGLERLITTFVMLAADRMANVPIILEGKWESLTMELKLAASLRRVLRYGGTDTAAMAFFHAAWFTFMNRWINVPETRFRETCGPEVCEISDETDGIAQITDAMEGLQPDRAGQLTRAYLQAGHCADTLLTEIGRTILWDDTNHHVLATFCTVQAEWKISAQKNHPARDRLLIGLVRHAVDIRVDKNSRSAVAAATRFAEGKTASSLFEG